MGARRNCVTDSVMEWQRVREFVFAKSEAGVGAYLFICQHLFKRFLVGRPGTLKIVIELVSHALLNTPHTLLKNNSSEN